jgi:hypothetical protein
MQDVLTTIDENPSKNAHVEESIIGCLGYLIKTVKKPENWLCKFSAME